MFCGCYIPDSPGPAIQFAHLVAETSVQPKLEPLVLPSAADYLAPFSTWKKLGNDRYANCVPVTWANMRRLVTSKLTGREVYPSMHQVMELYRTQNPNFDPKQGVAIQDLLKYLVDNGGPDGVRAIAFAEVKITENLDEIRQALAIFGSVWVGLQVKTSNRDEFDYRQPWTPPTSSNEPPESHSVLVGGYSDNSSLKLVTWGQTVQVTKEFAANRMVEAWVVVWPEHLASRRFMKGVNLNQLRNEFEKLTNTPLKLPKPSLNHVHYILPPPEKPSDHVYYILPPPEKPSKKFLFLEINTIVTASADSSQATYSAPPVLAITPILNKNVSGRDLLVDNGDLYHIRTETAEDFVEVIRVPGPAFYESEYDKPIVTAFRSKLVANGVFTIDNGDLYFIKMKNTSSGFIEVYFAPCEQHFQTIQRYVTGFEASVTADKFTISGGDLYLINKDNQQDASSLRIRCLRGNANYLGDSKTSQSVAVPFKFGSEIINIGANGDLYMIKSANTESKKVEVWIAQAENNYAHLSPYTTGVEAQQELGVTQATSQITWIV